MIIGETGKSQIKGRIYSGDIAINSPIQNLRVKWLLQDCSIWEFFFYDYQRVRFGENIIWRRFRLLKIDYSNSTALTVSGERENAYFLVKCMS